MVDVTGFIGTIESIFNLIRGLKDYHRDRQGNHRDRRVELVEFLIALKVSIVASRKVLGRRNDGDANVPDLWKEVIKLSVVLNNPQIIEIATRKFEFWSDPELYLRDPDLLNSVPRLEEFEKVCDDILQEFEDL